MQIQAQQVQQAWKRGGARGADELERAGHEPPIVIDDALGDLSGIVNDTTDRLKRICGVAQSLVSETQTKMDACLAEYERTDHASAGQFQALQGPR